LQIIFNKILNDKTQILASKAALKMLISEQKNLSNDNCLELGLFIIAKIGGDVSFEEEDGTIKEEIAEI